MSIKVAIFFGGDSLEYDISKKSGHVVYKNLNKSKYDPYLVEITSKGWFVVNSNNESKVSIDKNDFSFTNTSGAKIKFDVVFNAIHGTPGEDGKIQGYLDMQSIPYNNSGVLASSLTFDKKSSNSVCKQLGFRVPTSVVVENSKELSNSEIEKVVGMPCFVKPNQGGSSFGASKVNKSSELFEAIDKATVEGTKVIIEEYISGTEVTSGIINFKGELIALPLTEVVPKGDFFDYKAKYEGNSEEITPARISDDLTTLVQNISKEIYTSLNLKGMIRADYIIKNDEPVLIEVNTIPGLSEQSIVPQQSEALGISLEDLFGDSIEQCLKDK